MQTEKAIEIDGGIGVAGCGRGTAMVGRML